MSEEQIRPPRQRRPRPPAEDTSWEAGAASYSADAADAPDAPPAPIPPAQYGRVRVYPQYRFPVYQTGAGGFGTDEIVVTDFDKRGRAWAEGEARRQATEALGGPPNEDGPTGGPWWMGRASTDQYRWQPLKGTPRTAKPLDGLPAAPPWRPWLETETETAPVSRPSAREAEIMKTAMSGHGGQVPAEVADRDGMIAAGWLDQDGRVTSAGQQETRDYVQRAPGYQPERRYEGVLAGIDGYVPADAETWPEGYERDISPAEYNQRVNTAAAAGTPFVLRPQDVAEGDRVRDPHTGELGRVREVGENGVIVDYDQTGGVHLLSPALEGGVIQKVPRDATPASMEERLPPAEQAERYAARRAHFDEQHGPGKRGKKGWTAHKRGCRSCADIDAGRDGVGRPLRVVAAEPVPAGDQDAEQYPVRFTFAGGVGDTDEIRHHAWEAAADALRDQVGGWVIPEDGTGVLDTDAFIASIGGYVAGLGRVLGELAERLATGETPIAPIVGEVWADFAGALAGMSAEAGEVYAQWTTNEDNAHDLRRAHGEIPGASLFNVSA